MKISIITATLNSSPHVASCVESVLSQAGADIEYIIIDGGSTDDTVDKIRSYNGKVTRLISEPDQGMYDALNKGIRAAKGEIIGFLHSDDIYMNEWVIKTAVDHIEKYGVESCYGDLLYVDKCDTGKIVRYWKSGNYSREAFYNGWMPPHPTFFVRRSVYEKYGLFNLSIGSAADYELILRFMFKHGISTVYIPQIIVKMRMGGASNGTMKNRLRANRMDRLAWKVNGLKPKPWTLFLKPARKIKQYFLKPE